MKTKIPDTMVETDPMLLCDHLQPILNFMQTQFKVEVIDVVNGKGWGQGVLINKDIPFAAIEENFNFPDFVTLSKPSQMIMCDRCWKNIAPYKRYKNSWG